MTANSGHGEWESLAPWEKASQWYSVAPHIADEVMALARERAGQQLRLEIERDAHHRKLEVERAAHNERMDVRIWRAHLISLFLCFANTTALVFIVWHSADAGHLVPGLTLAGTGAGLTAGTYATSRQLSRQRNQTSETLADGG
jgi:uncharacterized membrane protein